MTKKVKEIDLEADGKKKGGSMDMDKTKFEMSPQAQAALDNVKKSFVDYAQQIQKNIDLNKQVSSTSVDAND
ncbi:MAG: hypothetical protein ACOH5I_26405 [Oligoflexus sp.]